ncbi:centrosomal protein of 162 kDa [Halichoeres trimaculatus]|uniref:centrosomal protein of 162 kDa n=1 Tax=Halichoeres trimaculatus TaxID=147232 RepID=UPI003D9EB8C1
MSHRLTKEELDEQFELFLKESVSDDSVDFGTLEKRTSVKSSKTPAQKSTVSWWPDDDHSDGGTGRAEKTESRFLKSKKSQPDTNDGLQGSGRSFRERESGPKEDKLKDAASVRDHPEIHDEYSVIVPAAANTISLGLDTLEEEEEKAMFFSQLEAGASSTIDYSKLNKELDSPSSSDLRKAEEEDEQIGNDQKAARVTEIIRESPGFPHCSEDFQKEEQDKEPQEEDSKMSPMLAKVSVSLYDSLEDTAEDHKRKETEGSLDRGQSCVQSGGSEMEALHEAYRQIHVVGDSVNHHYSDQEGRVKTKRPTSPSSPSHHTGQSLQPASTAESELLTAEELMRPIQLNMDPIRGFLLQPVSTIDFDKQITPHLQEKTFQDVTSLELHLKLGGKTDKAPGEKGIEESKGNGSNSPDSPDSNLTWNIRQDRLMKDQNKHESNILSQAGATKKQQDSLGSTFSNPSTFSLRKPATTSIRGQKVEGRTTATSRSSWTRRAAAFKTQSTVSSPLQHPRRKNKVPKNQEKEKSTDPGLRVSSELVSSVQSSASVLKQQMDSSLNAEAADHHQNIQLPSAEEMSQKKRSGQATDSATEERLQQMDKEIKEQETLIKGYQQENEKLYLQMKAQQAKSKANEEAMFNQNQTLLNQLAFTRDQIITNSRPVGNVCLMDHTQRIRDLLAQIDTFQRNEAKMCEDVYRLRLEKKAQEVDLQLMKKERDLSKPQAVSVSEEETSELVVLEEKHREEVSALKKKLQWCAENKEQLDRDASKLKTATAEIHRLKEQIEKLTSDVNKRGREQQRRAREKTVEAKKMQDLERQVKELEQKLRRRNPNSLPALIHAAARAGGSEDADTDKTTLSRINALLEQRIQCLEAELESHDKEAKRSLQAMEQQFHQIKLRYEQQISDLEQQVEQKQLSEDTDSKTRAEPWMSKIQTLEEELQRAQETHQEKEKTLQDQIKSLCQQLKQKAQSNPTRHQQQAEAAFCIRIQRLNQELAAKSQTIQELNYTVERLQKEGRSMLFVPKPRPEPRLAESKKQPGPAKTFSSVPEDKPRGGKETFSTAQYEKTYQPTVFIGSNISEVQQENVDLRRDLEQLQLQSEREKEALMAEATQAREELCRLQENSAEQLSSLKAEHLRALDQLRATPALEQSASKVTELTNKLQIQEISVKHLQEQIRELQGAKSALTMSRTREAALQEQLTRLLRELKEAKETQSPGAKLLCSLERKITNMELRHLHREKELQQVTGSLWQTLSTDQQSEVERWKHLAQDKSRELEYFRLELDSILDILRHLQRQGVVLTPSQLPQPPRQSNS